jgi:hypothetical protein
MRSLILFLPLLCSAQNGLTVQNTTGNGMQLAWSASSGFASPTYLVERCQGQGCNTFAQVGTSASAAYTDSGLAHYTYFYYRVRATDGSGNYGPYGRTEGAVTVDLALSAPNGDRCTAVKSLPVVTFTCNSADGSMRNTATLNNLRPTTNAVGYGSVALGGVFCMVAVNEDPANSVTTEAFGVIGFGMVAYSCSVVGPSASVVLGVM